MPWTICSKDWSKPEGKKLSKKERDFLVALKSQVEGDID